MNPAISAAIGASANNGHLLRQNTMTEYETLAVLGVYVLVIVVVLFLNRK